MKKYVEKKDEKLFWLKIWLISLNKIVKNQFEQNYEQSIWTEISIWMEKSTITLIKIIKVWSKLTKKTNIKTLTTNVNRNINEQFEQKYQQSVWTKIKAITLNKSMNKKFEQKDEQWYWTEIRTIILIKNINTQFEQNYEQTIWTEISIWTEKSTIKLNEIINNYLEK